MGISVEEKRVLVLVVEDDFLLRMDAVQMVEEAGFDVLEAANADEAISILEARSDINVIFAEACSCSKRTLAADQVHHYVRPYQSQRRRFA
jgi:PleD family two-component response regulator